jgi:hypothetical protein
LELLRGRESPCSAYTDAESSRHDEERRDRFGYLIETRALRAGFEAQASLEEA